MLQNATSAQTSHSFFHSGLTWAGGVARELVAKRKTFPLTARALVVLAGTTYLFLVPVKLQDDIVSSVIASSALGLVLLGIITVFASGMILRRTMALQVIPPAPELPASGDFLEAGTSLLFVLRTNRIRILPFVALEIRLDFDRPGELLPAFRVSGSAKREHVITTLVTFPHRGIWNATRIRFQLGDRAGLVRYAWSESIEQEFRISPKQKSETTLPVISSANRPGDMVTDVHNRQGDLYDMKPYHPADGMKRIVWKVFARRGELLARHPEASMTPEGQVVLFALAKSGHDLPVQELLAYSRMLRDLQLELFIGCEGMKHTPAARSPESALELMVGSAWNADATTPSETHAEALRFVAASTADHVDISLARVILFISPERFTSARSVEETLNIGDTLAQQGIEPVWIVASERPLSPPKAGRRKFSKSLKKVTSLLVRPDKSSREPPEFGVKFLEACLARKWHVIV